LRVAHTRQLFRVSVVGHLRGFKPFYYISLVYENLFHQQRSNIKVHEHLKLKEQLKTSNTPSVMH